MCRGLFPTRYLQFHKYNALLSTKLQKLHTTMIEAHTIQEIREAANADIVTLIGEHITLKKSGSSFKGKCPFHGDNDPSLSVSEKLGVFNCFVCGEKGDAIHFLIEHTGVEFIEIVKKLADQYHITLKNDHTGAKNNTGIPQVAQDEIIKGINGMKSLIRKKEYALLFFSQTDKDQFLDLDTTPWLHLQHPITEQQAALIRRYTETVILRTDSSTALTASFLETVRLLLATPKTTALHNTEALAIYILTDDFAPGNNLEGTTDWLRYLVNVLPPNETARKQLVLLIAAIDQTITRSIYKNAFFAWWEEKTSPIIDY